MTYATLFSVPVLLFGGIIFDLFGRNITVSLMLSIAALATIMPPLTSPNVPLYVCGKVIFGSSIVPLMMNPFINDYVKVQFRGKAMGLQSFGMVLGNLVSVAGLFTLTIKMKNITLAFLLLGVMQLIWIGLIVPTGLIAEPKVMDVREEKKINKKSFCGKIYSVLK